jgi:Leucine-rich repeat (LRR) protein
MTPITLETLRKTQEQLLAMRDELKELQGALAVGDASVLDRHKLVMEQIRELKESFVAQRDALSKALPDGRRLYTGQYEALETFASNNKLNVQELFSKITIEGGVVVECNFSELGLTTLEGLEGLQRIRALDVCNNEGLTSLKGIPTKALEELYAYRCSLTGNLSELSGADKLKELYVGGNKGLTSLKGIPTKALEELVAGWCGLTGDLSELSGAEKLKELYVSSNAGLTSLKGIPTKALETLSAFECGLTGDHTFLSKAPKLSYLSLEYNRNLTLDKSKFKGSVEMYV